MRPGNYVEKNVVASHKSERGLCFIQSNVFRGIGPLYQSLHQKYQLKSNQAFVNQRHDIVSMFGVFYCWTEYFLWADIVEFQHNESTPPRRVAQRPSVSPPAVSAPAAVASPPAAAERSSTKVFVSSDVALRVACYGQQEITGQPRANGGEAVLTFKLPRRTTCKIDMEERSQTLAISPGDYVHCLEKRRPQPCVSKR